MRERVKDGLVLSSPDVTTQEELDAYRDVYETNGKGLMGSYEFWATVRPDVLKRHKARTEHYHMPQEGRRYPVVSLLLAIHRYCVEGFEEGIAYEIRAAAIAGATRHDLIDTLSVAFIHSGHPGMYAAAAASDELPAEQGPPGDPERFPPGWQFDPDAVRSGMDFSVPAASPADIGKLRAWYENTLGEIPGWVEFMAAERPGLLKAYRDRYEHAIRDALPKQMLPAMLLQHHAVTGCRDGLRENVLLARAWGMTRTQTLNAIFAGVLHGGAEIVADVKEAAGDVLDTMSG